MKLEECLTKASWECWSWLCDATLSTGKLSCEAWEEVVLCLLRCEDWNRRKYAESISWKEDYILCSRSWRNRTNNVVDVINRIWYTSVLCYSLVVKVNLAFLVNSNIFKKSVSSDSVVDVRLWLFVKVDNLSIAAAFKVEYTVVVPAVLVITDEESLRICWKCSLTCTWKTKEDSCVLAVLICVGWAVHWCDALEREVVVHHWEHTLLHLTAVPCVDDNLLTACDVEYYCCLRVQTQLFVILNFCLGSVVNNEVRLEVL